jgi:hypothetical protein
MRGGSVTRLVWNAVGARIFEAGVDQGVLYVDGSDGVPWNGLVSVSESPSGGDVSSYYVDGIKYLAVSAAEEFEATVEAYTYPDEFAVCEGTTAIKYGLFATQQPKKSFNLCYRTMIGNDVDGTDHGFKIHLVYNAMVEPTQRSNSTIGDSVSPDNFSWKIVTKPPTMVGYKQTAHFVIDSREVPEDLLDQITDILYGSADTQPRLPSVAELLFIFTEYETSVFDAGFLTEEYFATFDAGIIPAAQTSTIDGGTP